MLVVIKAKNLEKFGNNVIGEYNMATNTVNLWFNSSRFDTMDNPKLEIPEIDIPENAKNVRIVDNGGDRKIKCSVAELKGTLQDGVYKIPYTDWVKTKTMF